jgi:hypothetical protein
MFSRINRTQFGKALPVQVSHRFSVDSAVFDDDNLVSCAGLVPVMTLAERTGMSDLLAQMVQIAAPRIKSGSANPAPKLATLIVGMCAGADCIDDVEVLRSGGMKTLFGGVYAPSTIGTLLREFTFGHARQLEAVLGAHLVALCAHVDLLPGLDQRAFVDIGHAKQGASYGHTKIAGKQVLRKGLSPLATTISTEMATPVIAGMRLRAGRANSGKGAGRMVAQAIATARAAGASGQILVRGDSAYGTRAVIGAARRARAQFSLVLTKNTAVQKAIDAIPDDGWTPVRYPGAVQDPDTGLWISDARCRRPGRRPTHPSPRIDATAQDHQHPRPLGPTATPTGPAPAHPLALVQGLACAVAQHHRIQPTTAHDNLTNQPTRPDRSVQEKLDRPADNSRPHPNNQDQQSPTLVTTEHRCIEAKSAGLLLNRRKARAFRGSGISYIIATMAATLLAHVQKWRPAARAYSRAAVESCE